MSEASKSGKVQNFYPIAHLPMFARLIDEQLEHDLEQLALLQQAEAKPHVLDDATVERVIRIYSESAELDACYRRQLERWRFEGTTGKTLQEINRLEEQVQQMESCHNNILELAKQLEGKTIEKVLDKSDIEIALDFLSGQL